MENKIDVIYARFSSELQRDDSIKDQERRCRDGLERMGIPPTHFRLIKDEAISGTSERRPGFEQIKALIAAGELGVLVVTEQSRLTRGDNAKAFIKDVVFQGGRFISITEGIDTDRKGWGMLVGFSEIHHSRSNEDTAERVRGGQEGRVLDGDGSAGDYPYGYRSEYVDPQATLSYHGRGPKPRKRVVIDQAAAIVIREVFERFTGGKSMSSITRWLTSIQHEIPRIGKGNWHHEHVRRMLNNPKYIGTWRFGKTTTVRDGTGKKKQVPVRKDQKVIVVERPHLRIIEQALWDKAQAKLADLMKIYGMKEGHKRRGPAHHYRLLYPKTLLGGLIFCAKCGSRLITGSAGKVKRMMCPNHRAGTCSMTARVPYGRAEQKILELFREMLLGDAKWVSQVISEMRDGITEMAQAVPDDLTAAETQLAQTENELGNLVNVLAKGLDSDTIRQRLRELEVVKSSLGKKVAELREMRSATVKMPDEQWVREQLADLAQLLQEELPKAAPVLREMLGRVEAEEVTIPGKKRGYSRLRFSIDGWKSIRALLADRLLPTVLGALDQQRPEAKEFTLDLGSPTRMDELGPKIVEMRRKQVKWIDIARQLNVSLGNAYTAFCRCRDLPNQAA
jgi:site-specific DNA recombinase